MHKRFGASSEKASLDQLGLFNEAEATVEQSSATPAVGDTETTVPEHDTQAEIEALLPRNVVLATHGVAA